MSASRRTGGRKLEALAEQLSERDLATLDAIGRYRLMTVQHVTRLIFHDHASQDTAARVCRRVLNRLHRDGLLHRLDRRIGGVRAGSKGYVYSLSAAGHRLLGKDGRRRPGEPGQQFVNHTLTVTNLGTTVTAEALDRGLEVLDVLPEPLCWRTYIGHQGRVTVKPDLYIRLADDVHELSWFIEVDMGTESLPTIQRKCQVYLDYFRSGVEQQEHGVFPKVLWAAPHEARANQLSWSARSATDQADLFQATTTLEAANLLVP